MLPGKEYPAASQLGVGDGPRKRHGVQAVSPLRRNFGEKNLDDHAGMEEGRGAWSVHIHAKEDICFELPR